MNNITIGFALCGSFCTFSDTIHQMKKLKNLGYNIVPIMSFAASSIDTRFGKSQDIINKVENICEKKIINTISKAEPIGPKKMVDLILISPCTGNTLAKISNAITDTPVTMAAKSFLRIGGPVLVALASNDALGATAQNIGKLINTKNIFFVPMSQDDPLKKPNSLVSHFNLIPEALNMAINKEQIQPIFK